MGYSALLPQGFRRRLRKLRNDVRSAKRSLQTPARPVFQELSPNTRAQTTGPREATLQVLSITPQATDAVTITLAQNQANPLRFIPGQFLTVIIELGGQTHRRPYSLCSDPADLDQLSFTVRRVPGGLISNHIHDHLRAGDSLRIFGPGGRFGTAPNPKLQRDLILVAGGSGITPIMSIMRALLAREPHTSLHLLYANRSPKTSIYHKEIKHLHKTKHLTVTWIFEDNPPQEETCHEGRFDINTAQDLLPLRPDAHYYLCGPAPMMAATVEVLTRANIAQNQIHLERFVPLPPLSTNPNAGQTHTLRFAHARQTVEANEEQSILDAGRRAGLDLPFSCAMGGCGACKIKLRAGKVSMESPHCLSPQEVAQGYCLACIAKPRTDLVLEA